MELSQLLSKNDYLLYISQYIGLETLTYLTSISKEIQRILNEAETVNGTLSNAMRFTVCREVYDSAVQRVDELLKLRKGFDNNNSNNINNNNNINSLKWKDIARVALQLQTLSFASWMRKPTVVLRNVKNRAIDRVPRCAHAMVNLGEECGIVYGGFGGTSWNADGWGLAQRAKIFAFKTLQSDSIVSTSNTKYDNKLAVKIKVPNEIGDIPCARYGHTMINLGRNNTGKKALLFGGFREAYFGFSLNDVYTIEWTDDDDDNNFNGGNNNNNNNNDKVSAAAAASSKYSNINVDTEEENDIDTEWTLKSSTLIWKKQFPKEKLRKGGRTSKNEKISPNKLTHRYDRGNHACAYKWSTKTMYVFGGIRDGHTIDEFASLNVETFEWTPLFEKSKGKSPTARYGCSMVVCENRVYVFGGATGADYFNEGNDMFDIHMYNINNNVWSCIMDPTSTIIRQPGAIDNVGSRDNNSNENSYEIGSERDDNMVPSFQINKEDDVLTPSVEALGRGHSATAIGHHVIFFGGFVRYSRDESRSIGMKFTRSVPITIFDCRNHCWKTVENWANRDIPWERFAHQATISKGIMLIHGGWTFETRSTVAGFHALDLSPMTSANRLTILSDADNIESIDKLDVPPVTSILWRVSAKSLLRAARARARAGTARLRRKKRNCFLATSEKTERIINYVSAFIASLVVFTLALIPTLVAIISWKLNVTPRRERRRND